MDIWKEIDEILGFQGIEGWVQRNPFILMTRNFSREEQGPSGRRVIQLQMTVTIIKVTMKILIILILAVKMMVTTTTMKKVTLKMLIILWKTDLTKFVYFSTTLKPITIHNNHYQQFFCVFLAFFWWKECF